MSYQTDRTQVISGDDEVTHSLYSPRAETPQEETAREIEEARARQRDRDARARALGAVPAPVDDELPEQPMPADNDRAVGSIGLFILRIVLAVFVGVRAMQVIFAIPDTDTWLANQRVPFSSIMAWVLGIVLIACTLMLVFGLLTRTAAVLVLAMAVLMLVFVRWGYAPMITQGQVGFLGETDFLIAGMALSLMFLGSGGWAIDGAMRRSRLQHG